VRISLAALLGVGAAGCQSSQVYMNHAAPQGQAPGEVYRLDALPANDASDEILLVLAFSGGGKRSSAYSYGALKALRDTPVVIDGRQRRLLDEVDGISSVSGGTFTAAYYGLHRERTFTDYEADFLRRDIEAYIYGIYLKPWNWEWLVNPYFGTNDAVHASPELQGFIDRWEAGGRIPEASAAPQ
jgi:NTE family protein